MKEHHGKSSQNWCDWYGGSDQLSTKPEVISIFNNIVKKSGVKMFSPELKINLLTLILSLYLKASAFS